jgi:hypothetical protein
MPGHPGIFLRSQRLLTMHQPMQRSHEPVRERTQPVTFVMRRGVFFQRMLVLSIGIEAYQASI